MIAHSRVRAASLRHIASLLMASALVVLPASPAAAAPATDPSPQPFESLSSSSVPPFSNVVCHQEPPPPPVRKSGFQYTVTGEATGPYPGTFRESGWVVIGQQSNPGPGGIPVFSGLVLSWFATFEITSTAGHVTGGKLLIEPNGFGRCVTGPPIVAANNTDQSASARLRYFALIQTPDGVFEDVGTTTANVSQCDCFVGSDIVRISNFLETYRSDHPVATFFENTAPCSTNTVRCLSD